jgi:hypothetical protein
MEFHEIFHEAFFMKKTFRQSFMKFNEMKFHEIFDEIP